MAPDGSHKGVGSLVWRCGRGCGALYDPAQVPLPPKFRSEHPFDNGELRVRDEALAPIPRTPEAFRRSQWRGRTFEYYRAQIRAALGVREAPLRPAARDGLVQPEPTRSAWSELKTGPGPPAVATVRAEIGKLERLRALGVPDDLVGALLFLASPASDFVIGHTLVVDGGLTCR